MSVIEIEITDELMILLEEMALEQGLTVQALVVGILEEALKVRSSQQESLEA